MMTEPPTGGFLLERVIMPIKERFSELWTKIALGVSGATTAIGALSLNEMAALIGIVCTVSVSIYSIYSKRKHLKIAQEIAKRSAMCATCDKVQSED